MYLLHSPHDRPGGPAPPEAVARFRTAAMELLLRRPEAWLAKRVCAAAHETFGGTRQPAASTVAVAVHMGIINAPSTASASNLVGLAGWFQPQSSHRGEKRTRVNFLN